MNDQLRDSSIIESSTVNYTREHYALVAGEC